MSRQSKVIKELKAYNLFLKESRTEAYDHIAELQEGFDQIYDERTQTNRDIGIFK